MKKAIILAFVLAGVGLSARAQEAASFLTNGSDMRGAAMGGISVALEADAFSVFNNAAASAFSNKRVQAGLFWSPWAKELTKDAGSNNRYVGFGGYVALAERSNLLVGFRYFGSPKSETMDEQGNPLGEEIAPKDYAIDLGYAYRLSDRFSLSLTARYVHSKVMKEVSAGAVGFDLGFMYHRPVGERGFMLDVGAGLYNLGSKLKYDAESFAMPGRVAAGIVVGRMFGDSHSLKGGVDLGYKITGSEGFLGGVGIEYMALNTIAVRGGYHFAEKATGSYNYGTVGVGVRIIDMVQADFTYLLASGDCPLKNTYGIALSVRF